MTRRQITASLALAASVFALTLTVAAQDRSTVKVPDGLALADFKGYESWQAIAPSETPDGIKAILGNNVMIAAYAAGIPANGTPSGTGSACGYACHTRVKARDFVFTNYVRR